MQFHLHVPENNALKPSITVFGVGGAGGNAVNNMINSHLEGAHFVVANTDAQALEHSHAKQRIQLGTKLTRGLGAGAAPEVGRAAAEESMDEILAQLEGSHMVFITAGMGGGTGTGAAPVIARLARERGILTVGVVTKPFHFEGSHRMRLAESGLKEMQDYVDTLIVIPNQNLFRIANEKTTFADAFKMADDVLHAGVRGVTDLITMPGLINLDFADIVSVMSKMGKAMMGTGEASGESRALNAAEAAISNPLLDHCSMKGARGVLINITGGADMTLFEVDEAANRIRDEVDDDANIIFGSTFNPALEGKMRVSVVATGIEDPNAVKAKPVIAASAPLSPTPRHYNAATPASAMMEASRPQAYNHEPPKIYNTPTGFPPKQPVFVAPKAQDPIRDDMFARAAAATRAPQPEQVPTATAQPSFNSYMSDTSLQQPATAHEAPQDPAQLSLLEPFSSSSAPATPREAAEISFSYSNNQQDDTAYNQTLRASPLRSEPVLQAPRAPAAKKSASLSLLSRIAASVKSKTQQTVAAPEVQYNNSYDESMLVEEGEVDLKSSGDNLDIPAFLRRKPNA
jgi:cell division protein FtsZ